MQEGPCNLLVGPQPREVLKVSAKMVGTHLRAKTSAPTQKAPQMFDASTQMELVAKLQETVKRLCSIRGAETEIDKWFRNHIPVVDTTENEAPWTLVTHKSRTMLQPPPSSITTKTRSKKSGKGGRKLAWISKELLEKLRRKKEVYRTWKKGLAAWEEYRNTVRVCRDATRKARAHLELNLARDAKDSKKGFFKYISSKRKTRENVNLLLNEVGALVMEDAEKAQLLNAFFASVFTAKAGPQEPQTLEVRERDRRKEDFPWIEEDQVRDHLGKLNTHKSMGPDGMYLRVPRELADVIAKTLSIIFERSWRRGEVHEDWRKDNVTAVFKKGKKEDTGNCRQVSLTSIPGKAME
ncbi:rna-directed dna polymerase from mobile element jockey-like [Limosa lapponica baueri]|uniref:Rna-directed dna polymerase from mobile element jockey-like n=1 Tax=Limosa lapponica baueri TaxID=1758121 RepID=A0A2I0TCK1_LIMLA|nr:rna-directed dna polymerase from mobile element jockey-like [Limosa lapponica baueri]